MLEHQNMQRVLEKKTVTRISFWFCGFIYCNLPLAVAGSNRTRVCGL